MFWGPTGLVTVSNGKSNGRSFVDRVMDGKIIIHESSGRKRIALIADGQIIDNRVIENGKTVYHIIYGRFKRSGGEIVRFREGSGTGKHGKSRTAETLFRKKGTCHSWYINGRLIRQRFIYKNWRVAYNYRYHTKACIVRDPQGKIVYRLKGIINCRANWQGLSILAGREPVGWFLESEPFEVRRDRRLIYAGQYENHQRTGKWVERGKVTYYERGVPIPKELYETPPEQLDVMAVLNLKNAQTRMALMSKLSPARIAEVGKVIHRQGEMRLYDIPGHDTRILRVKCPSTRSFYFLNVPIDAMRCEQARQWTFHVGEDFPKQIKFKMET